MTGDAVVLYKASKKRGKTQQYTRIMYAVGLTQDEVIYLTQSVDMYFQPFSSWLIDHTVPIGQSSTIQLSNHSLKSDIKYEFVTYSVSLTFALIGVLVQYGLCWHNFPISAETTMKQWLSFDHITWWLFFWSAVFILLGLHVRREGLSRNVGSEWHNWTPDLSSLLVMSGLLC